MKIHALRLSPGADLNVEIKKYSQNLKAAFIITCVGSLNKAVIRMAGAEPENQGIRDFSEPFEIVSLVGTLGPEGSHLHITLSNKQGEVIGGHLKNGCIVHTTAEIIIGEDEDHIYHRKYDDQTGFNELNIVKLNSEDNK